MTVSTVLLLRAGEVIGLPVVTIDGGEDVAEVKDIVYDGSNHRLIGLTLNKRGWFRGTMSEVLNVAQIAAIGADAVMVESDAELASPVPSADATALGGEGRDVLGNSVITVDGTILGTVSGVIVSAGKRPAAVGYELTGDDGASVFIPTSAQLALSGDNLIVPAELTPFVRQDLAGFGASVDEFRAILDKENMGGDPEGATE